ncbi:hypothetical protein E2562_001057 [Oryza meyeriana var. granulata]|uniref:Uncharacterized protein n=1 Tax=Oryza meyeriana var. granulata TaxID=110450 RepID=A0A6G1ED44_9ORYZ|nr:hypothetical protein E2562_001057 [Oryza meyeriana var. granulata]
MADRVAPAPEAVDQAVEEELSPTAELGAPLRRLRGRSKASTSVSSRFTGNIVLSIHIVCTSSVRLGGTLQSPVHFVVVLSRNV